MSAGTTFNTAQPRWLVRRPDGRMLEVATLPSHVSCSVCGEAVALVSAMKRVVCGQCGAYAVEVIDRAAS
jgi:ribosomal protein S27AE